MSIHNVISKFKYKVDYYYRKYENTNISDFSQHCLNLLSTPHNINSRYKLPTVTALLNHQQHHYVKFGAQDVFS